MAKLRSHWQKEHKTSPDQVVMILIVFVVMIDDFDVSFVFY